ncbi:MAG TPA: hypothetical protein VIT68_05250 [Candidatus Gracilibacteria bacterium]
MRRNTESSSSVPGVGSPQGRESLRRGGTRTELVVVATALLALGVVGFKLLGDRFGSDATAKDDKITALVEALEKSDADIAELRGLIATRPTESWDATETRDGLSLKATVIDDDGHVRTINIDNRYDGVDDDLERNRIRGPGGHIVIQTPDGAEEYDPSRIVDADLIALRDDLETQMRRLQVTVNGNTDGLETLRKDMDRELVAAAGYDKAQREALQNRLQARLNTEAARLDGRIDTLGADLQDKLKQVGQDIAGLKLDLSNQAETQSRINAAVQNRLNYIENNLSPAQLAIITDQINCALAQRPEIHYHYQVDNHYHTHIPRPCRPVFHYLRCHPGRWIPRRCGW